jgi:DeoR family transcriptional regulator, suf operon transcriptional repressor
MLNALPQIQGFRGLQRRVLIALKKAQPTTVKELAAEFKTTPNAVRRHLKTLENAGVIQYRAVVRGVGGPTFAYTLTEAGEALFPRTYGGALADALDVVREAQGIDGVVRVFHRQWESLAEAARPRMTGRSLAERTAVLAELRTMQGYMAESEGQPGGEAVIREHNCAIRDVAARFPEVCAAEARFFAELLGADVEREAHILEGCNACEYRVHASETPSITGRWPSPAVEEQV